MRHAFTFLVLLVIPVLSPAQTSERWRACDTRSATQSQLNQCASDELGRVNRERDLLYERVLAHAAREDGAGAKIQAQERAWREYLDDYVDATYPAVDKQAEYGSTYPMELNLLRARLTRTHIDALRQLSRQYAPGPTDPVLREVGRFVQTFYDWYVTTALDDSSGPAWNAALAWRPSAFAAPLLRALRADVTAQAKTRDAVVGLDWDPFLNAQDPCARYDVGRSVAANRVYRVEVHAVCDGRRHDMPDVVADVARRNGAWRFLNFDYDDHRDLLSDLARLRAERTKRPRR